MLIGPLGTNSNEIFIKIHAFWFTKILLEMSGKWRPFCLGFNVLTHWSPGDVAAILNVCIFAVSSIIDILEIFAEIVLRWMPQNSNKKVNIGSGNGLVPSGNKPLPEPNVGNDLRCRMEHLLWVLFRNKKREMWNLSSQQTPHTSPSQASYGLPNESTCMTSYLAHWVYRGALSWNAIPALWGHEARRL